MAFEIHKLHINIMSCQFRKKKPVYFAICHQLESQFKISYLQIPFNNKFIAFINKLCRIDGEKILEKMHL